VAQAALMLPAPPPTQSPHDARELFQRGTTLDRSSELRAAIHSVPQWSIALALRK